MTLALPVAILGAEPVQRIRKPLEYIRPETTNIYGQRRVDRPAPSASLKTDSYYKSESSKTETSVAEVPKRIRGPKPVVIAEPVMVLPAPDDERPQRLASPASYFASDEDEEEDDEASDDATSPSDKRAAKNSEDDPENAKSTGDDSDASSQMDEEEDDDDEASDTVGPKKKKASNEKDTSRAPVDRAELDQFQGLALAGNPGLREAAARIEAVRGKWIQAGLPPNPFVGYTGQQLASAGKAEQHGLVLGQTFITGKKLSLDQAAVCQEWQRARYDYEAQRLRILTDTALAYYEVLAAQRKIELAEELVEIGDKAVETANALLKAKERSKVDVLQAQVETQTVRLALETAEQRLAASWRLLGAVIGTPDLPPQPLKGALEPAVDVTWDDALARLRTGSPELAAAMAEVERARWLYQRALKQNVPNIDVQAIPFQRDNGINGWDGALQVGANIPVWNKNQGAIREAYMRIAVAEQAVDRIDLALQARLSLVFERYLAAEKQIARYERDILPAAREQLELVTQVYRGGEIDSLVVLVPRRTLAQTSLAYIDALRDRAAAAAEIEGLLLKESLFTAPGP